MADSLDKQRLFDNIAFLLKEVGRKIGELETEAGVSPGYISRTSKDGGAKPGIDFVINIADSLGVSIDTLIKTDLTALSPTERYMISFMEKLIKDTDAGTLDWNRESADSLNRLEADINGLVSHPLFSCETFFEQGEMEYPNEVTRVVMTSHSYDCHTCIEGYCYNLRMKNGAMLYLMDISKSVYNLSDPSAHAKEIWMYQQGIGSQYLCGTLSNPALKGIIEKTFASVVEYYKHPQIRKDLRYIIDSFLQNDWKDDAVEEELPF